MPHPAVFLDKDGTLIDDVPYNVCPELMSFAAGAVDGLRILNGLGYRLIVVSNQSGIARGYFPEAALAQVDQWLHHSLTREDVQLSGFYYCPHHPYGSVLRYAVECTCRKPAPGLLLRASQEHDIDLRASWMVGDVLDDIEAGCRAGCRTVLIDNGGETEWIGGPARTPGFIVGNLREAATVITARDLPPKDKEARHGLRSG